MRTQVMLLWALLLLPLQGCSSIYSSDEFALCPELPIIPGAPCPDSVAECLFECVGTGCNACYDANRDGIFDETEVTCFNCVFFDSLRCMRDNGCAAEVESSVCCASALCDSATGCRPDEGDVCRAEQEALTECATPIYETPVCNEAVYGCFGF